MSDCSVNAWVAPLKRCPFCGETAFVNEGGLCVWVECGKCGARSKWVTVKPRNENDTQAPARAKKKAIEAWNERRECEVVWI